VLHGDNGATLKATTVLAMLHWLGIKPSYSRPRVSDETVPNMGAIMLPCEMSGDAGSCCHDPLETCR
jgi:hypothetical protein